MARPRAKDLTQRELEIMQVFWTQGEATVADVRDALAKAGRDLAHTTVATLVKLLAEKQCLVQTKSERPFLYKPSRTFAEVSSSLLGDVLERVFGGSRQALMLSLFDNQKLTPRERKAIERLIQELPQ